MTLNVSIMNTADLLRYGKPETALEQALYDALKAERQDAEPWEQIAANYDTDTPEELEKLVDELKDNQKPDDYDDYVEFYETIMDKFTEKFYWPGAKPGDEGLQKAIVEQLELADQLEAENLDVGG